MKNHRKSLALVAVLGVAVGAFGLSSMLSAGDTVRKEMALDHFNQGVLSVVDATPVLFIDHPEPSDENFVTVAVSVAGNSSIECRQGADAADWAVVNNTRLALPRGAEHPPSRFEKGGAIDSPAVQAFCDDYLGGFSESDLTESGA